jgi:hypothetical protein
MSGLSTECWVALNGERNPRVPRNNIFLLERCARRGPPGAPATASEAGVVGADGADRRDGPVLGAEAIRPLDPGADRRETIGLSLDPAQAVRAGPKVRAATG